LKKLLFIYILFCGFCIQNSFAESFNSFYGSISSSKVNVRVGPGTNYPISWVYTHKNWPVEAVAEHQGWYKIRDIDGEEGWIYQRFFSKKKFSVIFNNNNNLVNMYKKTDGKKVLLKFESGVVVRLLKCDLDICRVSYNKTKGWVQKKFLIGAKGV